MINHLNISTFGFVAVVFNTLRFTFVRFVLYQAYIRTNKNALTAVVSLANLEIRSRNEEAINSTRNRIYSLKVFYLLRYRH